VTIVERLCERGMYPIAHRRASIWECDNAVARSLVEPIERPVTEECSYVIAIVIVTPFCSSSC